MLQRTRTKARPKAKPKLYPRFVDAIPDRHGGMPFLYFRRNGKRTDLPRVMGSEEFWRVYSACIAGKPVEPKREIATTKAGTFGFVINEIENSAAFQVYSGRSNRMTSFNRIHNLGLDNVSLKVATKKELGAILDDLAAGKPAEGIEGRPGAANDLQAAFGMIYKHADIPNPIAGRKKAPKKHAGGRPVWEDEDVEKFRAHHHLGTTARLALEVFLYTALRCVDACRAGPATLKKGRIVLIQKKLERFGERAEVSIPVHSRLQEAIDATVTGTHTWLVRVKGGRWTNRDLSAQFAKWCIEAGVGVPEPGNDNGPNKRAHGLRKVCARRLIEAGISPADAAAITGHIDITELMEYAASWERTKGADRGIAALA